jgi:hypothetical protein
MTTHVLSRIPSIDSDHPFGDVLDELGLLLSLDDAVPDEDNA